MVKIETDSIGAPAKSAGPSHIDATITHRFDLPHHRIQGSLFMNTRRFGMATSRWPALLLVPLSLLALPSPASAARPCEEDLQIFRTTVAKALADHTIDQQVYDVLQKRVTRIEAVCASGDDKLARALAIDGMIGLSLGADDTYARAVNAPRK